MVGSADNYPLAIVSRPNKSNKRVRFIPVREHLWPNEASVMASTAAFTAPSGESSAKLSSLERSLVRRVLQAEKFSVGDD
jgi:hypothetical protein